MTNPVTPNIGLNKIDRTSPSTTYFDLEKYIDQNADAVDRFAGETNESINALGKRLDTEERREVVLQPGLQIVNAERSAPFKLSGIKGRTLVNLLGRDGGCESLNGWTARPSFASASLDTSYKESGTASIKITQTKEGQVYARTTPFGVRPNSNLVAISYIKNSLPNSYLYMRFTDGVNTIPGVKGNYVDFGNVGFAYRILTAVELGDRNSVMLDIANSSDIPMGSTYNIDSVRVYEISAAEYAALDGMTPEQVAAKYPYVDSVRPVRNPYAIRYGENLLPPFYEWSLHSTAKIDDAYTLVQTATGSTQNTGVRIPIRAGETYTLSYFPTEDSNIAYINIQWLDANEASLGYTPKNTNGQTVNAPAGAVIAHVITGNTTAGTFTFKKPMLTLGSTPKPFKPREDSILALQTDLYADPLTGSDADEVFEKDGQYFKLAKWRNVLLTPADPNLSFEGANTNQPSLGYKRFRVRNLGEIPYDSTSGYVSKYNGSFLPIANLWTDPRDQFALGTDASYLLLTVANTDSGWGENYTPTVNEIKAYFMGWHMHVDGADKREPYNGTGIKAWYPITRLNEVYTSQYVAIGTVPTETADNYDTWTPYQLIYQLAKPTVKSIVSEGMLTLNKGDNQIEVGTGLVVRENAKPKQEGSTIWINVVNSYTPAASQLVYSVNRILQVQENGRDDPSWRKGSGLTSYANGKEAAATSSVQFNPSSAYSITYLMLDKSPIAPFTGSYAANEKSVLQELTDAVYQNATGVSVLMNKKAEKDTPGWITPTLLNGWIPYVDSTHYYGYTTAQYMKDSQGFVYLRGLIKKGSPSTIFYLPGGYRPKQSITFVTICYDGSAEQVTRIRISSDGSVSFVVGPTISAEASWLSLNLPPFTLD
ncbi:hypothetical protein ACXZ7E_03070 [Paenibacillus lautus]